MQPTIRSSARSLLTSAIFAVLCAGAALAASGADVSVLDPTPGATMLRVTLEGYEARAVAAPWLELRVPDEGYSDEFGAPALPRVSRSVIVPDQEDVAVRVVTSRYHDVPGVDVAPARGPIPRTQDPSAVPYAPGRVYARDAWYPAELAQARAPYVLRDRRGVVVDVNVLQYNPVTRVLRVYDEVVLQVVSSGAAQSNALVRVGAPSRRDTTFERLYAHHFVNEVSSQLVTFDETGGMLVLSNAAFLAEMQPFVDWKNARGIPTTLVNVATIGNNAAAIKSYVQQVYASTNLSYVLLVGDLAELASGSFLGGASDPTYSKITADNYPDLIVGRFSATTAAQVRTQVERSIRYEQLDHALAAGGWNACGMGVASNQGPGHYGEYDNQHMDNIRADELAYGCATVDRIYDPTATKAMITSGLNAGRRMVNYCGHGSETSWGTTGFGNADVNLLANEGRLPFVHSVACVNGNFALGTCFAEAWLRATHNGQPSGAVAAYMSSIDQYWDEPQYAQDESTDLFCAESWWGLGALWYAGSCRMMDLMGASGHDMFMTWILFGDPSLRVLGAQPPAPMAYCAGKTTSLGTVPAIGGLGTPSASAGDFRLSCDLAMPNGLGRYFYGTATQALPWQGGTLCVQPPIVRGPVFQFDAYGTAIAPVAFGPVNGGTTLYFQVYGRDAANADGTGVMLSNALRVDVLP